MWRLLPVRAPGYARALPVRAPDLPVRAAGSTRARPDAPRARSPRARDQVGQTTPPTPSEGGEQAPAGVPAGDLDAAGQP